MCSFIIAKDIRTRHKRHRLCPIQDYNAVWKMRPVVNTRHTPFETMHSLLSQSIRPISDPVLNSMTSQCLSSIQESPSICCWGCSLLLWLLSVVQAAWYTAERVLFNFIIIYSFFLMSALLLQFMITFVHVLTQWYCKYIPWWRADTSVVCDKVQDCL